MYYLFSWTDIDNRHDMNSTSADIDIPGDKNTADSETDSEISAADGKPEDDSKNNSESIMYVLVHNVT